MQSRVMSAGQVNRNFLTLLIGTLMVAAAHAQNTPPPPDFDKPIDYADWLNQHLNSPSHQIKSIQFLPQVDPFGSDNASRLQFRKMINDGIENPAVLSKQDESELHDMLSRHIAFHRDVIASNSFAAQLSNPQTPDTLFNIVLPLIESVQVLAKAHLMMAFFEEEATSNHFRRAADLIGGMKESVFYIEIRKAEAVRQAFYRNLMAAIQFNIISPEDAMEMVAQLSSKSKPLHDVLIDCITCEEAIHYSVLQAIVSKSVYKKHSILSQSAGHVVDHGQVDH